MTKPKRIQRKRTKGWKMPPNSVYVGRPTQWGNSFKVGVDARTREECIDLYRENTLKVILHYHGIGYFEPLRGKDLVCWCGLDQACHADLLLELLESTDDKAL